MPSASPTAVASVRDAFAGRPAKPAGYASGVAVAKKLKGYFAVAVFASPGRLASRACKVASVE